MKRLEYPQTYKWKTHINKNNKNLARRVTSKVGEILNRNFGLQFASLNKFKHKAKGGEPNADIKMYFKGEKSIQKQVRRPRTIKSLMNVSYHT